MITHREVALNLSNRTPPPKHMQQGITEFNKDIFKAECLKRGVNLNDPIIKFIFWDLDSPEAKEYGVVKLAKEQAEMAKDVMKSWYEPPRKAVDEKGSAEDVRRVIFEDF